MATTATNGDTSVTKVDSKHSPKGSMGQKYLASGVNLAMRLWENEEPGDSKPARKRDYETVGYVIEGRAELHLENQVLLLEPGVPGSFPRAPRIRTRYWNPSPRSRRQRLPRLCMVAMKHDGNLPMRKIVAALTIHVRRQHKYQVF